MASSNGSTQYVCLQNDSIMFTMGNLCKLLLAMYLACLDVVIERMLELVGKAQYAPRALLLKVGGKCAPSNSHDSHHKTLNAQLGHDCQQSRCGSDSINASMCLITLSPGFS